MARQPTPEELRYQQQAIADFPFERVETTGDLAFRTWEQLRNAGRGVPVVLGGDEEFPNLMEPFYPSSLPRKSVVEILGAAATIKHPDDLARERAEERAQAIELLQRLQNEGKLVPSRASQADPTVLRVLESYVGDLIAPAVSEPPEPKRDQSPADVSPVGSRFGERLGKVHIALIPTDDSTTIPAHLQWGGWNDCPRPEYHVAALRSWRDRFGAELVGLGHDTMHIRVAQRPQSRAAALELAREHYSYCSDLVDQGTGELASLAGELMASEWWFFWWD